MAPFDIAGSGGGGKGGGGGGSTPQEAPNTLRSRATARVIDLIGEGPVVGLVHGAQSIFFDDTPLQNADGSYNFQNVTWAERLGYPDQDPIPGFPETETETIVGTEVRNGVPVTREVTDLNANAVRITLRWPSGLLKQDPSTGNVGPTSVTIAIDVIPSDSTSIRVYDDTISGKTTTTYERSYRIPLPGTGPWEVRVWRVSGNSESVTVTDRVDWASFTTIIDHLFIYPDSHLIGIAVDAEAFGGRVPARAFDIKARIIAVPTNYDPETRQYSGAWDGTFKQAWTDNPAWAFYDMVTHLRYGAGEFITDVGTLKWDLYPIAVYCDELVPNGFGGMEPRFTFNGGFQAADEAYKVIQAIASAFRGMSWWGSGTVAASADMPADPVKLVSPANVIDGNFDYTGTALKARHTVAMVAWNDPSDADRLNLELVEDPDSIDRFGWRPINVSLVACKSRGQAHRFGRWILDSEKHETQTVTYQASWDHADMRPGMIVNIADPAFSGTRRAGRVAGLTLNPDETASQIILDAPVTLAADLTYTVSWETPDGAIGYREVTNPPGETAALDVVPPINNVPQIGAMWMLSGSDIQPRPFRVMALRETDKHLFEISGLFHDATKYARVEQNLVLDPPVFSTGLPTGPLLPPANLAIREYLYLAGGVTARNAVTVSWTPSLDPRAVFSEVQVKAPGLEWQSRATVSESSIDLLDFGSGVFSFRVRALDAFARPSPWVELTNVNVLGLNVPPEDVDDFAISILGDTATLTWAPVSSLNLSHYEIRFSPVLTGATWGSAVILKPHVTGTTIQVPATAGTVLIKAVTQQGISSANEALISSNVALFLGLNVIDVLVEDPDFAGAKDGTAVDPATGYLRLDYADDIFAVPDIFALPDIFLFGEGFHPTGYYYFSGSVDLGEVFTSRLSAEMLVAGQNYATDIFAIPDIFSAADIFFVSADSWAAELQFRSTNDDPTGGPVWSDWQTFTIGDHTARAYEFRAVLHSFEFGVTPMISALRVQVDMPDRVVAANDIVSALAGSRVWFLPAFHSLKGVAISAQGLQTGDYYVITTKDETGFDIVFRNSANAAVVRTFDHVSVGYGRQI